MKDELLFVIDDAGDCNMDQVVKKTRVSFNFCSIWTTNETNVTYRCKIRLFLITTRVQS